MRRSSALIARSVVLAALVASAASTAGDAAEAAAKRDYKLQLGAGFAAPFNQEDPFINFAQTRPAGWSFEGVSKDRIQGPRAVAEGYADPKTYMPTPKSNDLKFAAVAMFLPAADKHQEYYADTYVLDWKGEARGMMQRWDGTVPTVRKSNSVEYQLRPPKVRGGSMRFTAVGDGFSDIRLYRKKYAPLLEKGEIWNPDFINYARRYDIVRTLDLQTMNNSNVRRFDQIATLNDPWGQRATLANPEPPYFGIPYEALFNLGVKADVEMWMLLPPEIGSPLSPADPSLKAEKRRGESYSQKMTAAAAEHARETLESPEWDIFAKEFADRYIASGYPVSRPLYLEVGNEVWNFGAGFYVTTSYAIGIGRGVNPEFKVGQGYGVLVARMMIALEKEFARRGVKPNITYVIASHTANPWRTKQAMDGFRWYLKEQGAPLDAFLKKTGVAVTNYYGNFDEMSRSMFGVKDPAKYAPMWEAEIAKDPKAFAKRISDLLVNGPENVKATAPYIIKRYGEHKRYAEEGGSRFIGAYEGGSHLKPPPELSKSPTFRKWWMAYHWGEDGADVVRQINRRILAAYPGIILANYRGIGDPTIGYPWADGHYDSNSPMLRMWDEFARQDRLD